jgi:hypothetical protein
MNVGGQTRTSDNASDEAPDLELAESAQSRRGSTLAATAVGVAWVTMAVVGVTMLRPELAMVKRMVVKAAAEGLPAAVAPAAFAGPHEPTRPSAPVMRWWRYIDPTGFSVSLPDGWRQDYRSAYQVRFTNPAEPGAAIVIAYTSTPRPDQYADWEQQSVYKAETDPAYLLIGIHRVHYRGYNSADWEFTDSENGRLTHFLDHGFISAPGAQAYAIELVAPAASWNSIEARLWGELLTSFTPATHTAPAGESSTPRSRPAHGTPGPAPTTAGGQPSTRSPYGQPSNLPTSTPTGYPTSTPTSIPSGYPTSIPTAIPTGIPSGYPTSIPSGLSGSLPGDL